MQNTNEYSSLANLYADGVRALFTPAETMAGERGSPGPTSPDSLATQAEHLSPISAHLNQAITDKLQDPSTHQEASTQLLAKALTDLEICTQLFQAAQDEEEDVALPERSLADRSVASGRELENRLKLLTEGTGFAAETVDRSTPPSDLPTARQALLETITDTTDLILERSAKTTHQSLEGLFKIGLTEFMNAAAVVGMDMAKALGQGENLSRLYRLVKEFALRAYEALLALVGKAMAGEIEKQIREWVSNQVDKLKDKDLLQGLLEGFYQVKQTRGALEQHIQNSQATLDGFVQTTLQIEGLNKSYLQQIKLAEGVLGGLRFLGTAASVALPPIKLLVVAAYVLLGGYFVWAGGDYLDAPKLSRLNRAKGIGATVTSMG